ncbi:MAG TPA: alanine--tRNA ligase [Solirubrobacteraceae bacterium]|jgi:alanyl-tRNA synthetase|nr:alanine--tRNA ligase [Solirubrobacteraceae bacterium]
MTSDEIRERFLAFFEERGHRRLASASLLPPSEDRSVLLTTAGMQPLKPYFLGREAPPAPRLTSCQKCFRTPDIEQVGSTLRHLTFFEMLGNFSIGEYFKQGAIELAWELSLEVFGFRPRDIWVTVFEGDEALGLGPDEEAIELWEAVGVPRERIVGCPRSENFWEAGPVGPSGPCSELYLDRGLDFGAPDDLPGGENERFLEFWNLVFMQYNQEPHDHLRALPSNNIDTGLGLNRMAAILQGKESVFETDQFQPLIDLGQELSGRRYGEDHPTDRALRILADHARGMSFMVADGVVPSNEERGYVLRRVMRRAIQRARSLGMEGGFLVRYAAVVRELMGGAYPELVEQRDAIEKWLASEEESFGRTLEQGTGLLEELIERALADGAEGIAAIDAFTLHDTYGFPFDLTRELVAERGLGVDAEGFEQLMAGQRARARAAAGAGGGAGVGGVGGDPLSHARELAAQAGFQTRFTGYETESQRTTVGALAPFAVNGSAAAGESAVGGEGIVGVEDAVGGEGAVGEGGPGDRAPDESPPGERAGGRYLLKLAESPFYPAGGGQVSDVGVIECERGECRARVEGVFRLGEDQALAVVMERGTLDPAEPVLARVDHAARHATECNHTATHLLHAALRGRLGTHVRQAGSYVGPDKLRFDFSHSQALTAEELRDVEDCVNGWILDNDPVRPITTTLEEARRLGAMALFGEKYGDVVRMVQIGEGEYSRELCGGTHVRSTAEIGPFHIQSETSSAANVRRIEALTGPAAVQLLRAQDRRLAEIAATLRTRPEGAPEAVRERELERRRLEKELKALRSGGMGGAAGGQGAAGSGAGGGVDIDALVAQAAELDGARVLSATIEIPDPKALPELVDRLRGKLPDAAIVLGGALDGRVHLIVGIAPSLVARGVKAGTVVKAAAAVVGGGGGGRDTLAQAGGRDVEKLDEALAAGRAAIEAALGAGGSGDG